MEEIPFRRHPSDRFRHISARFIFRDIDPDVAKARNASDPRRPRVKLKPLCRIVTTGGRLYLKNGSYDIGWEKIPFDLEIVI